MRRFRLVEKQVSFSLLADRYVFQNQPNCCHTPIGFVYSCIGKVHGLQWFNSESVNRSPSDVDRAIDLLVWRSDNAFDKKSAQQDLWLAAKLSALKSDSPNRSRMLIQRCLAHQAFGHVADAYGLLASMEMETDPQQAVHYWTLAVQAEPEHPDVGRWWCGSRISMKRKVM